MKVMEVTSSASATAAYTPSFQVNRQRITETSSSHSVWLLRLSPVAVIRRRPCNGKHGPRWREISLCRCLILPPDASTSAPLPPSHHHRNARPEATVKHP